MTCLGWLYFVAIGLHGFSFPVWHDFIDQTPRSEVIVGTCNLIRSDDYLVVLPQMLSQRAHFPPFPIINTLIGDGDCNMLVNYSMPVRSFYTLFRPQTWGFFVSSDLGLSFFWAFNAFGLWLVCLLLFYRVTEKNLVVSVAGATFLLYAPFYQHWSLNACPNTIFGITVVLSVYGLWSTRGLPRTIVYALLLFWSVTAFLLHFSFLPYQITIGYFIVFAALGLIMRDWKRVPPASDARGMRWVLLGIALSGACGIVACFIHQNWDAIEIVRNSSYPGHRLCTGGHEFLIQLFRGNFLTFSLWDNCGAIGNICEAASFIVFLPLILACMAWSYFRGYVKVNMLTLCLVIYEVVLIAWVVLGFPDAIAQVTWLNRVPNTRVYIGIGLADSLLLGQFLARHEKSLFMGSRRGIVIGCCLCALWFALHLYLGFQLPGLYPGYSSGQIWITTVLMTILGAVICFVPRIAMPMLALLVFCMTAHFNPLVRGGTNYIQQNMLSRTIVELNRAQSNNGAPLLWITYGDKNGEVRLANLFRMLGVRCLNGLLPHPQSKIWDVLDPNRNDRDIVNRYCYLAFVLSPDPSKIEIQLQHADSVLVSLHPEHPAFDRLGIHFLLYVGNNPVPFDHIPRLKRVYNYNNQYIYEVRPKI